MSEICVKDGNPLASHMDDYNRLCRTYAAYVDQMCQYVEHSRHRLELDVPMVGGQVPS